MTLFDRQELDAAMARVHAHMPPSPQRQWPQLSAALGAELWVKHENHNPTGAFKVRGGITFINWLRRAHPEIRGIVTATRGNHGQSQALAATAAGLTATILVPRGNSREKNAAMRAYGGEVIEFGDDFDTAREEAGRRAAADDGLMLVPPFHRELVSGVATYALELFTGVPDLDVIYVPIGCGSGICGLITVRDLIGLDTRIVGVVSTAAPTAKLSFEAGRLMPTDSARTFADGMAVRVPVAEAFDIYYRGAERVVAVSDDEVAQAMRLYFSATHNVAEGAGAAPLAAALAERNRLQGLKVGVILCGANVDSDVFATVLSGGTPELP